MFILTKQLYNSKTKSNDHRLNAKYYLYYPSVIYLGKKSIKILNLNSEKYI